MLSLFSLMLRASLGARPLTSVLGSSVVRLGGVPRPFATVRMSDEFSGASSTGRGGYGVALMNGHRDPEAAELSGSRAYASEGMDEAPSAKQEQYARAIAERLAIPLPADALVSRRSCSEFIEQHAPAGTAMPTPSDKQIMYAQRLAAEANVDIPDGTLERADMCARFIEDMLARAEPAASRPPSDKQLTFANDLAVQHGVTVPPNALADSRACSQFIDELRQGGGEAGASGAPPYAAAAPMAMASRPPTERQLTFAQRLASNAQIELPPDALTSSAAISEFIDSQLAKPSDKMILYAAQLARERRVGLDSAVIADKTACSAFIDSLLAQRLDAGAETLGARPSVPPATPYGAAGGYGAPAASAPFENKDVHPSTWDMPGRR
ncbi:hypothetical protein KFE25_007692 [Diacronema lutheri]|uniref:Uncharacterized protein n=1 Tax=Diacronema lutheri TaxID=2081491 RepID=A0A8J5Y0R0_DIALT|nr:hypothetical protein KFE25_007692 [Diacronema lutheri]